MFNDINNILKKIIGIDQLIEKVTTQIGDLEAAYLTGDFANGRDSQIIDLVLIGVKLDTAYINELIEKTEIIIERKIRHLILTKDQLTDFFQNKPTLLIWKRDE